MPGADGDVGAGMPSVVIAAAFGGPEVLSVVEEPAAEPGPGQARIAVRAAGVNPVDYKAYSGAFGTDPARLPVRPGAEAAGVVTAVGPDAVGPAGPVAVGDEVIAYRAPGAYATELVVPAAALVPKPAVLDWAQAAGLMVTGVTAWHLLAATGVHEGRHGPDPRRRRRGGADGAAAAAGRRAIPVVTASPAKHGFLRDLGALPVAYGPGAGRPGPGRGTRRSRRGAGPGRDGRGARRLARAGRRPGPDRHHRRFRARLPGGHQGSRRRAGRRPRATRSATPPGWS
jgi:hypothetical protein